MMSMARLAGLVALGLVGLSSASLAATRNVPVDYPTIQAAIDASVHGDEVVVAPGTYGPINFGGRDISVRSTNPDDAATVAATVISGSGGWSSVRITSGEGAGAVLSGFTITNADSCIVCFGASPSIIGNHLTSAVYEGIHCGVSSSPYISGNTISNTRYGIWCDSTSSPAIIGNTIRDCTWAVQCEEPSSPVISNCIIAFNGTGIATLGGTPTISYCNVYGNGSNYVGAGPGLGCISVDPLFASATDSHLKSKAGRWDGSAWVTDDVHSPCIDAGDPASPYANETDPNGGRINMGAYGNTAQASLSYRPYPPDAYEPDDSSAAAKAIASGEPQSRNIHEPGNMDWATFSLASPAEATIETSGAAGDTEMWLYSSNGSMVAYDDDSGIGSFSQIERKGDDALPAGTYFIRVQERDNNYTIEAYTLSLTVTPLALPAPDAYEVDDTSAAAKSITCGETQDRNIHAVGNVDWAKFSLSDPSEVIVTATDNTRLWLYNSAGAQVGSDAGSGLLAEIGPAELPAGDYYIRVQARGNTIVDAYTLSLNLVALVNAAADAYEEDDTSATAKWISPGDVQNRSIHAAHNADWAKFTLTEPTWVLATTTANTRMWLYQSSGALVQQDAGNGILAQIGWMQLPAGAYFLRVRARDAAPIEAYTLSLATSVQ